MTNNIEILAPAGNMDSLEAALKSGANAIYIGGQKYSARNNAENFSIDDIKQAVHISHLYNAKVYFAVNTVVTNDEIQDFYNYIKETANLGIDAYIVQDLGCAYIIKKCVPDAVLHSSTQMTIHSLQGALLVKELGFSRVVPARELSSDQLKEISKADIEIEAFVHGALCMSVSGQCYMSAMIGSRSANRGCCGQACRLPFSALEQKNFPALSLKDLSLIQHTNEMLEDGICSFKIEGRMKRPEYVASSVDALKKALNNEVPDMSLLRSVFSRDGFTDGYFTNNHKDMFGTRLKKDVVSTKNVLPQIHQLYRKVPKVYSIDFHIEIKKDFPVKLTANCYGLKVEIIGECPQIALKRTIDLTLIEKQLSKLGDTVFEIGSTTADIENGLTISASELNNLRRLTIEKLENLVICKNTPKLNITDFVADIPEIAQLEKKASLRSICANVEQAKLAHQFCEMVVLPIKECFKAIKENVPLNKICIEPPRFIDNETNIINDIKALFDLGIRHILCVNPAYIKIGKSIGLILHGGFGLNVTNSFSAIQLSDLGLSDLTLSFELKLSQLKKLYSPVQTGIIAYGRLPLMLMVNCPIKNEIGCQNCENKIVDRTSRELPVKCFDKYVEILNPDVLMLSNRQDIRDFDFLYLIFNEENPDDVEYICENFWDNELSLPYKLTNGLYYRGII